MWTQYETKVTQKIMFVAIQSVNNICSESSLLNKFLDVLEILTSHVQRKENFPSRIRENDLIYVLLFYSIRARSCFVQNFELLKQTF